VREAVLKIVDFSGKHLNLCLYENQSLSYIIPCLVSYNARREQEVEVECMRRRYTLRRPSLAKLGRRFLSLLPFSFNHTVPFTFSNKLSRIYQGYLLTYPSKQSIQHVLQPATREFLLSFFPGATRFSFHVSLSTSPLSVLTIFLR